jgi:AcrR family transcriptional regulator
MPPKITFTSEAVTAAGFDIVRERGFGELSARMIADRLKSSTGPVYTAFTSMDEIRAEVIRKAEDLLMEYACRPYTKSVFLNMGTGITLFALENPVLFRSMFMETTANANIFEESIQKMAQHLDEDELVSRLSDKERADVVNKMSIFTYGYASLICTGIIKDVNKKTIIKTMLDIGRDVIGSALARCGKQGRGN